MACPCVFPFSFFFQIFFFYCHYFIKLNKMTEAIDDCTEAIKLDGSYLKAYLKRARRYLSLIFFLMRHWDSWSCQSLAFF